MIPQVIKSFFLISCFSTEDSFSPREFLAECGDVFSYDSMGVRWGGATGW